MRRCILASVFLLFTASALAQEAGTCSAGVASRDLHVNEVRARMYNTGTLFWKGAGNIYTVPEREGVDAIFLATLQIGGLVGDEIRYTGSDYGPFVFVPGPLDDHGRPPEDCSQFDRIYSIRRDSLLHFERTGEATKDLLEWPAHLGAPVINGDGIPGNYDLAGGDRPALIGDQMVWWVMNDAASGQSWRNPPLPIEVQITAFAFDGFNDYEPYPEYSYLTDVLRHATFYRYRLVYKGNEPLEDAWFSIWTDTDLGAAHDDFVGSDSALGLGFTYNGDELDESGYGSPPPALGFDFFKGPVLLPDNLDNDGDGAVDEPGERGGATRFIMHSHNNTVNGWPGNAKEAYDLLRGIWRDGTPLTKGGNGYGGRTPVHFMFSGRPGDFWSEENTDDFGSKNVPGDRHFNISTGPFRMEPGDEEDIYLGIIWSRGKDRLDSVRKLKADDAAIQSVFDELIQPRLPVFESDTPTKYALAHNHPNPFRDRTTIGYLLPKQERVLLTVYDVLGRKVETLVDDFQAAGTHSVEFEAGDLPPGIYFYELQAGFVRGGHLMALTR